MKKSITRIIKLLTVGMGIIVLAIITSTIILQTNWGKDAFTKSLQRHLSEKNVQFSFQKLGGILPFSWQLKDVVFQTENEKLEIDQLDFRLDLIRLIRKEIAFRTFKVHTLRYTKAEGGESLWQPKGTLYSLPYPLYVKSFSIQNIEGNFPSLSMEGKLHFHFAKKFFFFDVTTKRNDLTGNLLHVKARAQKNQLIHVQGDLAIDTLKVFSPWINLPFDANFFLSADLVGSWQAFGNLLFHPEDTRLPIKGKTKGAVFQTNGLLPIVKQEFGNTFTFSSVFDLFSDRSLSFPFIQAKNEFAKIKGNANFSQNFKFDKSHGTLEIGNLSLFTHSPIQLEGGLTVDFSLSRPQENFESQLLFHSTSLQVGKTPMEKLNGSLNGTFTKDSLEGDLAFSGTLFSEDWNLQSQINWPYDKDFELTDLQILSPYSEWHGTFAITPKGEINGETIFRIDDLYHLQVFFPYLSFYGGLEGTATVSGKEIAGKVEEHLDMHLDVFDAFYENLHANQIFLDISLNDLLHNPLGSLTARFDGLRFHSLLLESLTVKMGNEEENWPFEIYATGNWKAPLEIVSRGFWRCKEKDCLLDIQEFSGHLFSHPFDMPRTLQVTWNPEKWQINDFEMDLASSKLLLKASVSKDSSRIDLIMDHFPLDFLSLNALDLDVDGYTSTVLHLEQNKRETKGHIQVDIQQIRAEELGEKGDYGTGFFEATLEKGILNYNSQLLLREKHIIESKGNVPFEIDLFTRIFSFPKHGPINADFTYDARAEEILDFINTGPHRFEGDVQCHLLFKGTFEHPLVEGSCDVLNGIYENYYTGTYLENIQGHLVGEKGSLVLDSFSGKDSYKGNFFGQGKFVLDPDRNYPFAIHMEFSDLTWVEIKLVKASAEGAIDIRGDAKSATAEGTLQVVEADFSIPDKIPSPIPSLNISYINEPIFKTKERSSSEKRKPYPLNLQLSILAPENIYINGRGLSSQWRGNFKIGGTYDNISAKGKLELLKGEFVFSGRAFDLVQGTLTFTGQSNVAPYLDLSGKTDQKGIVILANLKGRLNAPHLTFKSIPSLPLSAILSYLIFGQDISEISPYQAGQLAASAASLAGEGPDILELARKTLGVDRLAVVTTPTAEGEEAAALQVGKYLSRGILFSVSQGSDPSMGNVSVEVDLTHGFIFQAEAIPKQEEGRFTVKWNINY